MTKLELITIAQGLRKNVWNKEMRLRAAAVIIQVAKEGNPKLDEFDFMKEADCIPGLAA
jgi:hypothetical protein